MSVEELAAGIHQRNVLANRESTLDACWPIAKLVERYGINLDLSNFSDQRGIVFQDLLSRSVAVYQAQFKSSFLLVEQEAFTDVMILASGKMTLGWAAKAQIKESDGAFTVAPKQLRLLPDAFSFNIPCPHMSEYGGIYSDDDEGWICFGCDELILSVTV